MAARVDVIPSDAASGPGMVATIVLCAAIVLAVAAVSYGLGWWMRGMREDARRPAPSTQDLRYDPLPPPAELPAAPANYVRTWQNSLPEGYWGAREDDGWSNGGKHNIGRDASEL